MNLTGTMLACKHAIRTIKRFGYGGSIVNISSVGDCWVRPIWLLIAPRRRVLLC